MIMLAVMAYECAAVSISNSFGLVQIWFGQNFIKCESDLNLELDAKNWEGPG